MSKHLLVGMMALAAIAVLSIVWFFTGSIKWALGVAGVCFAIDLTFAPWIKQRIEEIKRGKYDE
jgi:hypothetical protein